MSPSTESMTVTQSLKVSLNSSAETTSLNSIVDQHNVTGNESELHPLNHHYQYQ